MNYLTVAQNFALEITLAVFERAGLTVYLVGSSLQRPDFRDVDLRCVLDDHDFDNRFGARRVELRLINAAISEWIGSRTGLPIDFQFQPYRELAEHKGKRRNPMGLLIECEQARDEDERANAPAAHGKG